MLHGSAVRLASRISGAAPQSRCRIALSLWLPVQLGSSPGYVQADGPTVPDDVIEFSTPHFASPNVSVRFQGAESQDSGISPLPFLSRGYNRRIAPAPHWSSSRIRLGPVMFVA